ncbi:hypothetical protein CBR_g19345 [Chara braunii]|uniref:protein-serine/threonine phosphatase n=1 Tax=Chara braunii TaxID=69332 RepID=A0A388KY11_CHABU|nr:hypothetical protein CBR_g19345 [Chara braunii]|eukprot:GBG74833.1 hypothetical protein CBR_g19345 [Chara braunii]
MAAGAEFSQGAGVVDVVTVKIKDKELANGVPEKDREENGGSKKEQQQQQQADQAPSQQQRPQDEQDQKDVYSNGTSVSNGLIVNGTANGTKNSDDVSLDSPNGRTASKPPRPGGGLGRRCQSSAMLMTAAMDSPHAVSSVSLDRLQLKEPAVSRWSGFKPVIRSGGYADIGGRMFMEDAHVRIDDISEHVRSFEFNEWPRAFFGVFDGHGGQCAAEFVSNRLLRYIVEDADFPRDVESAVRQAFHRTDLEFDLECGAGRAHPSGTTALTALVYGRTLFVANVGDCRAVLCKRGRAVELSRDHKPCCAFERARIEALGGYVEDGYLNGLLAVARAVGDWHLAGLKVQGCGPLIAEPEFREEQLTSEDEFMILGCDGLWDVFSSQNAVEFARRNLQKHNDPERCSQDLVQEAIKRSTCDNVSVLTVCFTPEPPPQLSWKSSGVRRSFSVDSLRTLQESLDAC